MSPDQHAALVQAFRKKLGRGLLIYYGSMLAFLVTAFLSAVLISLLSSWSWAPMPFVWLSLPFVFILPAGIYLRSVARCPYCKDRFTKSDLFPWIPDSCTSCGRSFLRPGTWDG